MQSIYNTQRLLISELNLSHTGFILQLINTPDWIKFIGERNIKNKAAAIEYISNIIDNPNINYWVVAKRDSLVPIGIISFIQREYLEDPDIGFAFLAEYAGQGYAHEATEIVLNDVIKNTDHNQVLATTIKENPRSISLLTRLGFQFSNEIKRENECLLLYAIGRDTFLITQLTKTFFSIFTNANQQQPGWEIINMICIPEILIIKKSGNTETIYNLDSFLEPRKIILSDGTLTEFEENELSGDTKIAGKIAQRFSKYKKRGYLEGKYFEACGTKLFQFVKTITGWKISSLIWEDH